MIELTVQIIGHLGTDSKLVTTEKGSFISFPVYAELYEGQKLKGVPQVFEVTSNRLNLQAYLKKGTRVFITGPAGVEIAPTKDNKFKLSGRCLARRIELLSPPTEKSVPDNVAPEEEQGDNEVETTCSEDPMMEELDNSQFFS